MAHNSSRTSLSLKRRHEILYAAKRGTSSNVWNLCTLKAGSRRAVTASRTESRGRPVGTVSGRGDRPGANGTARRWPRWWCVSATPWSSGEGAPVRFTPNSCGGLIDEWHGDFTNSVEHAEFD